MARFRRLRLFRGGPLGAVPLREGAVGGGTPGREEGFSRVSMTAEFRGDGGETGVEGFGVPLRNRAVSLRLTGPRMGRASDKVDWRECPVYRKGATPKGAHPTIVPMLFVWHRVPHLRRDHITVGRQLSKEARQCSYFDTGALGVVKVWQKGARRRRGWIFLLVKL